MTMKEDSLQVLTKLFLQNLKHSTLTSNKQRLTMDSFMMSQQK
jgi:hypothetical protein